MRQDIVMRSFCLILLALFAVVGTQAVNQSLKGKAAEKEKFNLLSLLLPSSSILHPLDFQGVWQAGEPVPIDIFYKVPVYGQGDLQDHLTKATDQSMLLAEKKREREYARQEQDQARYLAEKQIAGLRRRLGLTAAAGKPHIQSIEEVNRRLYSGYTA